MEWPTFLPLNDEANDDEVEDDEFGNRLWCEAAVPAAAEGTFSPLFLLTLMLLLLLISVAWFLLLLLLSLLLLPREIRGGGDGLEGGGTRGRAADDDAGVGGADTNRSTCEIAGLLNGLETMASWFCW